MSETGGEAPAEPTAAPEPPNAPPPEPARRRPPVLIAALLIALAAGIGAGLGYGLGSLSPRPATPAVSPQQLSALTARVATAEDRIKAAEENAAAQSRQLGGQVDTLDKRVSALGAADASAAGTQQELARLGTVTDGLGQRLSALEKQFSAQAKAKETAVPLLSALLRIHEAIDMARPFPAEYASLQAIAKDRPDVAAAAAPLAAAAADGVPSRAALQQGLDNLADKLAAGAAAARPDRGWQAQALARLRGLVTIRRVEEGEAKGPQGAVATARRALGGGDLAAAVAALQPLAGDAAAAARPWLRQARQRLAAETALQRLQQLATVPPAAGSPS
jgi:hypothetical protein